MILYTQVYAKSILENLQLQYKKKEQAQEEEENLH